MQQHSVMTHNAATVASAAINAAAAAAAAADARTFLTYADVSFVDQPPSSACPSSVKLSPKSNTAGRLQTDVACAAAPAPAAAAALPSRSLTALLPLRLLQLLLAKPAGHTGCVRAAAAAEGVPELRRKLMTTSENNRHAATAAALGMCEFGDSHVCCSFLGSTGNVNDALVKRRCCFCSGLAGAYPIALGRVAIHSSAMFSPAQLV
jgi:hypothetical protein